MLDIESRQRELDTMRYSLAIVIGAGGIGSWVAFNLALSCCVDTMILIDDDVVESTNLNRTPFRIEDIGEYKVDALKFLILERRPMDVIIYREKTTPSLKEEILNKYSDSYDYVSDKIICIDCRDDLFYDFYDIRIGKYYKVGYDGMDITLDGNPADTKVMGRADGYRIVPSFICPTQLAANLVVSDILIKHKKEMFNEGYNSDYLGRLNNVLSFNASNLLYEINKIQQENLNANRN